MSPTARASSDPDELAHLRALAAHVGLAEGDARIEAPRVHHERVNGLRLRWLEWGEADAPPVVLLHGGGQSARTWDACCLSLATRRRCIVPDQRGHGDSEWSHDGRYALEDHASDIGALMDRLGLERPLLVGMSMGGANALAFATRHAQRLRGLVCIDVGPHLDHEPVARLLKGMARYQRFSGVDDAVTRMSALGARRSADLLRWTLSQNLRRDGDSWTWKYDPRTLADLSAEQILAPRRALWARLDAVTCPTLVVRGGSSEIFSTADAAEFVSRLPDGRLATIPDARHSVQTDQPVALARALLDFDASCTSTATKPAGTPLRAT